jgi:hypothetical protein
MTIFIANIQHESHVRLQSAEVLILEDDRVLVDILDELPLYFALLPLRSLLLLLRLREVSEVHLPALARVSCLENQAVGKSLPHEAAAFQVELPLERSFGAS